jgi:hypothetical protein
LKKDLIIIFKELVENYDKDLEEFLEIYKEILKNEVKKNNLYFYKNIFLKFKIGK